MVQPKKLAVVAVATLVGIGLVDAQPKKPATPIKPEVKPPAPTVDYVALADRLVGKTANVKEGDIVQIVGGPTDITLMEELAVAVRTRGAHPMVMFGSEAMSRKMIAAVPAKWDNQAPAAALALAKVIKVRIVIPPVRDPSIEAALPPERRLALEKASIPVMDLYNKRGVRLVELGNGFLPSATRAKLLGLSEAELTKMFWDGVTADYTAIEEKAKAVKAQLAAGGVLHITHANGTDLTLKVKGRKVFTSDGVISDADVKAGGVNVNAWLPAGEVYVTPVPGSAKGKLVDDRMLFDGKEVTGVTLEIDKGKITSINAASGWDAVKGHYDAAGAGKAEIGLFDVGINPAIKSGGKLESWIGAGMVSIGTGNNTWAGGTNKEPFGLVFQLTGTTVTLDGKPLVTDGALQ